MQQKDIIEKLKNFLVTRQEVLTAYLFGSYAENSATPLSDIDVALLVTQSRLDTDLYYQLDITADILSVLHTNNADVVILNNAPLLLTHHGLQLAIQNLLDISSHILSSLGNNKTDSYTDIILQPGKENILPGEYTEKIKKMAGLRNILVHEYHFCLIYYRIILVIFILSIGILQNISLPYKKGNRSYAEIFKQ